MPLISGRLRLLYSEQGRTRLTLLLVLSIAGANLAVAQGFSLSGTVHDPNRKPLANVAVELVTRSRGHRITGTDEKGRFVVTDLVPGNFQVSFELAGYATVVRTFSVKFDKDPKDDNKDDDKDNDVTLVPVKEGAKKR